MTRTFAAGIIAALLLSCVCLPLDAAGQPPASQPQSRPESQPARERLMIAGEEFLLEVAATPAARERGLMHRERIEDDGGMLFIYPQEQILSFWMKNCPIEMDIVFVNDVGEIVATHRMKPALPRRPGESEFDHEDRLPRYESRQPAQFAIELKAGTVERLKIKPGQRLEMDVPRLTALAEHGE